MTTEDIKNLRRKLKKARDGGRLQEISDCCCNLAAFLSEEEEHEEALSLYKESLIACEALGNQEGIALANRMIAEECINLGYFDDALTHVIVFLKYARENGDKVEEQRGLVLKGHVYFTQAEYLMDTNPKESKKVEQLLEQSMDSYRKSFVICTSELKNITEKERMQMKARLLQNKSLVLSRQNKLEHAQAHLIRAIKICAKEKLNDTEHICYLSLGDLYLKKNEPQKALCVYDKAFELSHSTQKKRDSLVGKAKTFIAMEEYQKAKTVLKKAFKLRVDFEVKRLLKQVASIIKIENNLCATPDSELNTRKLLYKKLGDNFCSLKNYKKGIKCYLNMLSSAQKSESNRNDLIKCYNLLCKAFTRDKQYDKALFYSHQEMESLSKWAPEKAFKTYLRIAKLHELNSSDFEEIQFAYVRAKSKAQQFENCKLQIKCLKHLIRIGKEFEKLDLVQESERELENLKSANDDSGSSCNSDDESDSEGDSESDKNSNQSSDTDLKDLLSDSDVEKEEYDRPKERCKRTKFSIKRNEKGETDLHVASIKGNYKRVKHLIDQGHPVNVRDTAGWTPLHEACNHGYVDIVNILLDYGANINDKGGPCCDGTTPLHDAATNGQLEVIETLVKRGASTLVLNNAGQTPLQCLLAWEKQCAMDADEAAVFQNIVAALKSPLDSADIKRHIKPTKPIFERKTSGEMKLKKNPSDVDLFDVDDRKSITFNNKPKRTSPASEYKETIQLLRRNRNRENSSESESGSCEDDDDDDDDDDVDDDDSSGSVKRKKKKSARNVYREAIESMRRKPKPNKTEAVKTKPKPALIDEREYVDNCIMDNDDDDDDDDDENERDKSRRGEINEKENDKEEICQPRKRIKSQSLSKSSLEEEYKVIPWLKSIPADLLEDCFDASPKKIDNEVLVLTKDDESEIASFSPTPKSAIESLKVDLTVKLFNEKVTVSVNKNDTTRLKVDWLIQEVGKLYPVIKNFDSFVTVKVDSEEVEESCSIEEVLGKNIDLSVNKWKSLPLCQRYQKACSIALHPDITSETRPFGFRQSPNPQIVEILKKSSSSRSFNLSNLKLSSITLIPVCKTLKFESFVQSLNLSNNHIGDKGVELIVKLFEKCIIEELDISGCSVTSCGVYHFGEALNGINELSRNGLEVINLSNNPITDDAVVAINNIIERLPNLRSLDIDHCELETSISTSNSSTLVVIQGNKFESPSRKDNIRQEIVS